MRHAEIQIILYVPQITTFQVVQYKNLLNIKFLALGCHFICGVSPLGAQNSTNQNNLVKKKNLLSDQMGLIIYCAGKKQNHGLAFTTTTC